MLGLAGQAWQHLMTGRPVHMNCPFAEPLYRSEPAPEVAGVVAALGEWLDDERPWLDGRSAVFGCETQPDWSTFSSRQGVLVAGRLGGRTEAGAVSELAEALGWPLLTDLQSQLRSHPAAWPYPTLGLQTAAGRAMLERAEVVLQFGGRLVGKAMNRWLAESRWTDRWLVDPSDQRLDPAHRRHRRLRLVVQLEH